jgi:hypothetical protein
MFNHVMRRFDDFEQEQDEQDVVQSISLFFTATHLIFSLMISSALPLSPYLISAEFT